MELNLLEGAPCSNCEVGLCTILRSAAKDAKIVDEVDLHTISLILDLTCKRGSVGQSEGLSIPRSSIRFRLKPDNSESHEFELHRPSNKGTKLL